MDLLIAILATYLFTILLVETEGPFGVFYRLRKLKPVQEYGVLNCVTCTAVMIAIATALTVEGWGLAYVMTVAAIAGAVTAMDKIVEGL